MSDIKILRLSTGEDVITKVTDRSPEKIHVEKAFVIIPQQVAPGKPVQLVMTPHLPYSASDSYAISADKVVAEVDPKPEILASYQKNTSQILQPNPGLITETKLP